MRPLEESYNSITKAQLQLLQVILLLESCDVIKKGHPNYKEALSTIILPHKKFAQNVSDTYQKEIQELENKLSGI